MDFTEFSLIYPDETSRKRHDSGESVPDIDLFTLQELGMLEALSLKNSDLSSFFTTDPAVMKYRIATFDDMMRCEELTVMLNRLVPVLNDIMELRRLEADSGDPNDYLSSITEIELYVSSVDILHTALTKVKSELHSPAFTALTELVTKLAESDYYRELNQKLSDLKAELFNLRFQHAINQLDNPLRLQLVRKDIARVKTVIREKELKAQ